MRDDGFHRKEEILLVVLLIKGEHHHFRRLTILVMACRIVIPAFSVSLRERPTVTQTFNAGCGCHSSPVPLVSRLLDPLVVVELAAGMRFSLQIMTLFARHYILVSRCGAVVSFMCEGEENEREQIEGRVGKDEGWIVVEQERYHLVDYILQ